MIDRADGKAKGHLWMMEIRPAHGVFEVGWITYSPALQRTRPATEAIYLVGDYGFGLGYRRYEWKCNNLNEPSKRAALRYGFKYEGLFRQHMVVKGKNRDTAWYSIIDGEWPERKAAFERWLAPENFDAKRPAEGEPRLAEPERRVSALRRATRDDLAAVTALQQAAYAKNRALLGVEPLPLTADYGQVFSAYEIWLADGAQGLDGVLILEPRADDLLIWSVATAPAAQGTRCRQPAARLRRIACARAGAALHPPLYRGAAHRQHCVVHASRLRLRAHRTDAGPADRASGQEPGIRGGRVGGKTERQGRAGDRGGAGDRARDRRSLRRARAPR